MADQDLTPAIVQDADDGRVLMLAWMDEEALRRTRETGEAWFWSRSREELWHKGETSGNTLAVEEIRDDCDGDAILLRVRPAGPGLPHRLALLLRALALAARRRAREGAARGLVRRRACSTTAGRRRPQGRRGGRRGSAGGRKRERRAPRRGARRPLVPQLRLLAARGLDPAAVEDELRRPRE